MKIDRAKQIMDSPFNIQVLYNNHPVWIESVDEKEELVEVTIMDMKKHVYIPSEDLVDTGKAINRIKK